jgi:hypothetical protein
VPLLQGKAMLENRPTVYVCRNFACGQPLVGLDAVKHTL